MSIKDRISFWEQKKVVQQVKPFPKPLTFQSKKPTETPTFLQPVKQTQQSPKINTPEKVQPIEIKKQNHPIKVDLITQKTTQTNIHPLPIQPQLSGIMKTQLTPQQNQDKIISVKANINKFNNLSIPILGQSVQSCIVGSFKKREATSKVQNQNEKNNVPETSLANSMPLFEIQTKEQHQLTFKQKLLMAQKAFANRNGQFLLSKKTYHEPKQNQQIKESQNTQISQQKTLDQVECKEQVQKEKKANDQSNRLFQDSIKDQPQKPTLLLGGQTHNLTLQTRMTRRVKRKNDEDDFDDL